MGVIAILWVVVLALALALWGCRTTGGPPKELVSSPFREGEDLAV